MEQTNPGSIDLFEKEKIKTKKAYIGNAVYFSIFLSIINFGIATTLLMSNRINALWYLILLFVFVLLIPIATIFLISILVKKEKMLKHINNFSCMNQYLLNILFGVLLWLIAFLQSAKIEQLDTIINLYSISWVIFGISVTVTGVWLSINSSAFFDESKKTTLSQYSKTALPIGTVFVLISLLVNLIVLLFGISPISNGNAIDSSSYFVAAMFISGHTVLDIITFMFAPLIARMIYLTKEESVEMVDFYNRVILTIKELENKIQEMNKANNTDTQDNPKDD